MVVIAAMPHPDIKMETAFHPKVPSRFHLKCFLAASLNDATGKTL